MPYEFECAHCHRNIFVKFLRIGETAQCPWCKQEATVPMDAVYTESPSPAASSGDLPPSVAPQRDSHPSAARGDAHREPNEDLNSLSKGFLWSLWNLLPAVGSLVLLSKILGRVITEAGLRWMLFIAIVASGVVSHLGLDAISSICSTIFLGLGILTTVLIIVRIGWKFWFGLTVMSVFLVIVAAAALVPRYLDVTDEAKTARCLANQRTIEAAVALYMASDENENHEPPQSLEHLVPGILEAVPYCPEGGRYIYNKEDGSVTCTLERHQRDRYDYRTKRRW